MDNMRFWNTLFLVMGSGSVLVLVLSISMHLAREKIAKKYRRYSKQCREILWENEKAEGHHRERKAKGAGKSLAALLYYVNTVSLILCCWVFSGIPSEIGILYNILAILGALLLPVIIIFLFFVVIVIGRVIRAEVKLFLLKYGKKTIE